MFLPRHLRNEISCQENQDEFKVNDIQFINIAYRPEPAGSATGGPNGVLKLLRDLVGSQYRGFYSRYYFEPKNVELPQTLKHLIGKYKLGTISLKLLEAEYYVSTGLPETLPKHFSSKAKCEYVFICHDIGSAVGAYSAGYPYILVYHQQGSFAHERASFGEKLSSKERWIMDHYEKIAFENAMEVVFPSQGARQAFENTTTNTNITKINFGSEPVYNAADNFEVSNEDARIFLLQNGCADLLDARKRKNYFLVVTIGDYSYNKGVDRCPALLEKIARKTGKQVVWIALGSKHKGRFYEKLLRETANHNFKSILIPRRLPHSIAMGIVKQADWFLMQQRHAIFDFSSLEAMSLEKGLILSPVEGNLDFDINNNVIYYDPDNPSDQAVDQILRTDPKKIGKRAKDAYITAFSRENFLAGYLRLYDRIIEERLKPQTCQAFCDQNIDRASNAVKGKTILIVGAGESSNLVTQDQTAGKVVLALNRALLNDKYICNIHMMQNAPLDANAWPEYLSRNPLRFYGNIRRRRQFHNKLPTEVFKYKNSPCLTYNLSDTGYDTRHEKFNLSNINSAIMDALGVFFSAVQVCAILGAKKIECAGIDFSEKNFDGQNPNKYNINVIQNFTDLMTQLRHHEIDFEILHTTSNELQTAYDINFSKDEEIIKSAKIASNLRKIVDSKKSVFRNLQALALEGQFDEVLYYLDQIIEYNLQKEPKFLRERAQALFNLERYEEASVVLEQYFKNGGESAACKALQEKIKSA